jgi:hypothetical protein
MPQEHGRKQVRPPAWFLTHPPPPCPRHISIAAHHPLSLRCCRAALEADGQHAAGGSWCLALHHTSPVPAPCRRNEVLVPLSSFDLWGPQAAGSS